ncbi:hypothetical protein BGY98DRAFT_969508 [Russula aff. rugulosa BPL654]|nr:hypothetical protein BGY98DRAFT_969508 [Russula aff. rugulosa BPL654]
MMSVGFAIRIASSASSLALWKPSKGASLGSHIMTMLVFGWDSSMIPSLLSIEMDVSWSSCGDASSALFTAAPEGSANVTKFEGSVVMFSRKWVSASKPA